MPSRYKFTKVRKSKTNERVYVPTLYPKIEIEDTDRVIVTRFGDRLDTLAFKYYKDVSLWWIIAVANGLNDGKIALNVGTELRVPMHIDKILEDLKTINDTF